MEIRSSAAGSLKALFMTAFLFLIHGVVWGQSAWELNTENEGIKIYTQQFPDSKVKAIKVESEVKATLSQLVALLMDVNTSVEWLYHTKSSILIKRVSPAELYYYSENKPALMAGMQSRFCCPFNRKSEPGYQGGYYRWPCRTWHGSRKKGYCAYQ